MYGTASPVSIRIDCSFHDRRYDYLMTRHDETSAKGLMDDFLKEAGPRSSVAPSWRESVPVTSDIDPNHRD